MNLDSLLDERKFPEEWYYDICSHGYVTLSNDVLTITAHPTDVEEILDEYPLYGPDVREALIELDCECEYCTEEALYGY